VAANPRRVSPCQRDVRENSMNKTTRQSDAVRNWESGAAAEGSSGGKERACMTTPLCNGGCRRVGKKEKGKKVPWIENKSFGI
jgi:radical SAM protein with 4Fe4S-binding SPASM domain